MSHSARLWFGLITFSPKAESFFFFFACALPALGQAWPPAAHLLGRRGLLYPSILATRSRGAQGRQSSRGPKANSKNILFTFVFIYLFVYFWNSLTLSPRLECRRVISVLCNLCLWVQAILMPQPPESQLLQAHVTTPS